MKGSAGYATCDLTPGLPCDLNGFVSRRQPALGVRGRILGRILVLKAGRQTAAVIGCDLLGFTVKDSQRLERAVAARLRIPARHVFLACTHNHSGPMSMPLGTVGRFRPGYVRQCLRALVAQAAAARRDLAPVTRARIGSIPVPGLGQFRCLERLPGRKRWPGRLSTLTLERADRPPVVLLHLGIHPYALGPRHRYLHPDYPGAVCAHLERHAPVRPLFLTGCGADVSLTEAMATSLEPVNALAARLAGMALATMRRSRPLNPTPLQVFAQTPMIRFGFIPRRTVLEPDQEALAALEAGQDRVLLNTRQWKRALAARALPSRAPFPIRILRLGSLLLVGMPAELFHDTGMDLAKALPRWNVWTVSHTGGLVGYLPRPFSYRHGTYESAQAHEWYRTPGGIQPGTEASLRRAVVTAVRKRWGGEKQ